MLYLIVGLLFLLFVIIYYVGKRISRWRAAKIVRRDIENGVLPPSREVGPRPTLSGTAQELNDRIFPRYSVPDGDPYIPYHRRDLNRGAVRRDGEEPDPELPTYVESADLPSPLRPAHTAWHPRASASTERLILPAYSPAANPTAAPPKYAPPARKDARPSSITETPIVRTL